MLTKSELTSINDLGTRYQELAAKIRVEQYEVPLNLAAEGLKTQLAYEAGDQYNPQFVYSGPDSREAESDLVAFSDELRSNSSPWLDRLRITVSYMVECLIDSRNHAAGATTLRTKAMFGDISLPLRQTAQNVLEEPYALSDEATDVTAEGCVAIIRDALSRVSLNDWTAFVEPHMNAMMDVTGERREIRIRQGTLLTRTAVTRLLVHEIGCHVFRSASGIRQPIRLLGFGLGDYLTTEEGLACYQEAKTGLEDPADSRRLALRYLAAALSLERSLFDVYTDLRKYADHAQAFETAARAKRGIADTSQAGCHLKDKVYFEGIEQVSDHLRRMPEDLDLLYLGKVSLGMIPMLKEARLNGDLIQPAFHAGLIPLLNDAIPI